jgi:2-dehydro-3-deoxyphosphogluconate aldolase/(4S)-4-hydroxy-2-oxoglutarate aldolase
MTQQNSLDRVAEFGVVPVVTLEHIEKALPLADALLAGGLPIIEITFRTPAAAEIISILTRERPQLLVGAGTVLTSANLEAAKAGGAAFGVAPGLNPKTVAQARELGLPFIPGIATASEIESAMSMGCNLLKFFPAEASGGAAMIDVLFAPFRHTGVRVLPSGGVTADNMDSYLKLPGVAAVGSTWIARPEAVEAGDWKEIQRRAESTVAAVTRARHDRSE